MIYELRTYQAGGGRMAEMAKVMASDCTAILQRAKVPRPLGAWHAVVGPRLPAFVWILAWGLARRAQRRLGRVRCRHRVAASTRREASPRQS